MFSCGAVPLAQTRQLRQTVLRPHETLEQLAAHEPVGAFAVGAFDGEEFDRRSALSRPTRARRSGACAAWTAPHARGRGAGTLVLEALLRHADNARGAAHLCNARTPARSLYERAGLSVVSRHLRSQTSVRTTSWS